MGVFVSERERRFWILTIAAVATIYATLGPTRTFADALRDRNLTTVLFALGLLLVVATVIASGVRQRAGRSEVMVWLGIAAVYVTLFARIGLVEERTHLIEYGVVAVFVLRAFEERFAEGQRAPAVLAVLFTSVVGWVDEGIQAILPSRVYDIRDVGFNVGAAVLAVVSSRALRWAASRVRASP